MPSIDLDFLTDVWVALKAALPNPESRPSQDWIEETFSGCGMPERWEDDPEYREVDIEVIVDRAVKRAKREGYDLSRREPISRHYGPTAYAFDLATYDRMRPRLIRARREFFDTDEAPYRSEDEMCGWLEAEAKREREELEDRRYKLTLTLTYDLSFDEDARLLDVMPEDQQQELMGHTPIERRSASQLWLQIPGKLNSQRIREDISAPLGGRLEALWRRAEKLADISGWWRPEQALRAIMIVDSIPAAGMSVNVNTNMSTLLPRLTLTITGPRTPDEVARAYKAAAEEHGINVKPLNITYCALLALHHETPDATWKQRWEKWEQWCEKDKRLKLYRDPDHLRVAYHAARKAIGRWRATRPFGKKPG